MMPEEHDGDLGFNYAWDRLIRKAATFNESLVAVNPQTSITDREMFTIVWWPVLAAVSYGIQADFFNNILAFDNADDSLTLQKAVIGFHHVAGIAAQYQLFDIFDSIIISLAKITGLLKEMEPKAWNSDEGSGDLGSQVQKVDPWAVDFGSNFKGQVATILMFSLVSEHGNWLRGGWFYVCACFDLTKNR